MQQIDGRVKKSLWREASWVRQVQVLRRLTSTLGALACAGSLLLATRAWGVGGDLLWQDQFDLAGANDTSFTIVAAGVRVFAAGRGTNAVGDDDFLVRAYDSATAAPLWQDQVDGGNAEAVASTVGGKQVFAVGRLTNAAGDFDFLVRAYDGVTGALVWQDQFDLAAGDDEALALAVAGKQLFVGGSGENAAGDDDFLVRAYDGVTGALVWQDQVDGGNAEVLAFTGGSGRVFAAGRLKNAAGDFDFVVRAYDSAIGTLLWQDQLDLAGGDDKALALSLAKDRLFAAGNGNNAPPPVGNIDFLVRTYNSATGALVWADQFDLAGGNDEALALGVIVGKVIAAGRGRNAAGNDDFLVRAYDRGTGALLWQDQLDSAGGNDEALALAVKQTKVFTAGRVTNAAGNFDFPVRAYNGTTGALLWQDQFDLTGGDDEAFGIHVIGGRVFAGGRSWNAAGNFDFLVRTYDAE